MVIFAFFEGEFTFPRDAELAVVVKRSRIGEVFDDFFTHRAGHHRVIFAVCFYRL